MARKKDVNEMRERLARLNERTKLAEAERKRLEEKRKKIQNLIAEEERKKRTHNLCEIGGLVYKYFGKNLAPSEFKEMLDFIFAISEVHDFVNSEKEKRIVHNNSSVTISEKNIIESDNLKFENA